MQGRGRVTEAKIHPSLARYGSEYIERITVSLYLSVRGVPCLHFGRSEGRHCNDNLSRTLTVIASCFVGFIEKRVLIVTLLRRKVWYKDDKN